MAKPQKQEDDELVVDINKILTPIAIVTSSLILSIVLLIGLLSINSTLKSFDTYTKKEKTNDTVTGETQNDDPTVIATEASLGDDARIGNPDAKVALIEFSDFNCSFCQKFHSETFDQIKKDYVDTNKILYVYKDFPGVGGDTTLATASAAECIREQKDDATYFSFMKKVYAGGTDKNDINTLVSFAKDLGLDEGKFKSCAESGKYKDEVNQDLSDAMALGIGGTPSFYIGKINSDGTVVGEVVVGAQPYSTFQATLDKYLN